jgi:hypothetical protein
MLQNPYFHGRVEFLRRHVHSPREGIGGVPSMPGEEPREQMTLWTTAQRDLFLNIQLR